MAKNYLKLNDDKTEFIIIGSRNNLSKVITENIKIGNHTISLAESVKNLGAHFDSEMSMEMHIMKTAKSAWFHLNSIGKIRKYLTQEQTKTVIHSFVTSKLDQNNSLLYGVPKVLTDKLQSIQNASAKLIVGAKKFDHVTQIKKDLHWLPVQQRIKYKILLLTYKALNNQGPGYIKDMLTLYEPSRTLRSSTAMQLVEQRTKSRFGDRAFCNSAPRLWNSLPLTLRCSDTINSFKTGLKTYLFKQAYD